MFGAGWPAKLIPVLLAAGIVLLIAVILAPDAPSENAAPAPAKTVQAPPLAPDGSPQRTFTPDADTFVSAAEPAAPHGRSTQLQLDIDPRTASFLRFPITGLNGPVRRATLVLYPLTASSAGFSVLAVDDNLWSEDGITLQASPRVLPDPVAASGPVVAGQPVSIDVTGVVTGNGPRSFALVTTDSSGLALSSRESPATAPQLIIAVEPSPDGALLPRRGDPVIAAAGDIACDPTLPDFNNNDGSNDDCKARVTSNLIADSGLAGVLALGDLADPSGTPETFQRSYDPTWGRLKSLTRPVPGAHDYQVPGAFAYFDYFGEAAGPRDRGYYSFDIGEWHIAALNSECAAVGGCGFNSPQIQWLRADLARNQRRCTLAFWHKPRFTSTNAEPVSGTLEPLWITAYNGGVDVVLNAGDHVYERFAPQNPSGVAAPDGIRQFTVGTGGRRADAFGPAVRPNSEVRQSGTFGVLELTLHPGSYDWRFLGAFGPPFFDAGTADCY